MNASDELLRLVGVTKRFGDESSEINATLVLKGIDLTVGAGESVSIVGPSGSGKSTLLNIIGALDRPTSGMVTFDEKDLSGLDDDQLAEIRNRQIGFIFQAHHLLPQCTALENVQVPALVNPDARRGAIVERATELLKRVGLGERMHHRPGQLSGGERQRVAVVRALINQPRLLLADEPTGSLDSASSQNLTELLAQLNREDQLTLIVVTHDQRLAGAMHTRYRIQDGQILDQHAESVT